MAWNDSLVGLLWRGNRLAERLSAEQLFEAGTTPVEARILDLINAEDRMNATELAEAVGVRVSTVTRALRRMEGYGYLCVRKGRLWDARRIEPELTPLGRTVQAGTSGFEADVEATLLRPLKRVESAMLISALTRVCRAAAELTGGEALNPECGAAQVTGDEALDPERAGANLTHGSAGRSGADPSEGDGEDDCNIVWDGD